MKNKRQDVDALLKARAEIDEQLRRHKSNLTVLFTDIVGSTSYFERNGDTAGLAMIHRHDELAKRVVQEHQGKVVKSIGDSAMAEFPDPAMAVRAAVQIERQFLQLNLTLQQSQRVEVRIGIHTGVGFRKGEDLFGDVVNVTARIVKRTGAAQILISRAVHDAVAKETDLDCHWLSTLTLDGRAEKEDIFEVVWTEGEAYRELREKMTGASGIPARYRALSQLGTGGTGIVYKVLDLETNETVALKILKPEIASDPTVQENFKRELCLARKITHKNVCRIHEFSRANGIAYISMEYVEGESLLSKLTRSGALPVPEAVQIAREMCAGLREAHAQKIIHRDLKPANIMLDRANHVKVMDFGVARLIHRDTQSTGTIVGTPAYMAPEQAELKPLTACTDIYALGLVLYEMLTGFPAFYGDTPVVVALKQIREVPRRPREIISNLPAPIEAVILKCLQKEPAKRFQSVDELDAQLAKALNPRVISAWRAAVIPALSRADLAVRRCANEWTIQATAWMEKQDWRRVQKMQRKPAMALAAAVLVVCAGATVLHGNGKSRTAASPAVVAPRTLGPVEQAIMNPGPASLALVTSHPVDWSMQARDTSSQPNSLVVPRDEDSFGAEFDLEADESKSKKAAARPARPKPSKNFSVPAAVKNVASAEKIVAGAALVTPVPSVAPSVTVAPEPVILTSSAPRHEVERKIPAHDTATTSDVYLEVGSFKDEMWATHAVDKLTQLGFQAFYVHKAVLWAQSYHVQVGPYNDLQQIETARQKLTEHGFKSHPAK